MMQMKLLSERRVNARTTEAFLQRVLTYPAANSTANRMSVVNDRAVKTVGTLRRTWKRLGSDLVSWHCVGLLNSVSEYVDHHRRARSDDHRRDATWFGQGAQIKQRAWEEVSKLVS